MSKENGGGQSLSLRLALTQQFNGDEAERYGRVKMDANNRGGGGAKGKKEVSAAAELRAFRWTNSAVGKGGGGEELGGRSQRCYNRSELVGKRTEEKGKNGENRGGGGGKGQSLAVRSSAL
ncbi:hypothetical protein niasHS_004400 [Heterodera schachtii]|uniref:Uncharacterized protein n=1 Tax=Heterodera schachtii TaxID=97005 RepID=A0ABD2JKV0_HETSC